MVAHELLDTPRPPTAQTGAAGDLRVRNLRLAYGSRAGDALQVLDLAAFDVPAGRVVGITGPSGAGKTSLLYVLTGIERAQEGEIRWGEVDIARLGEGGRDRWRRRNIGMIFQDFHLFPGLSPVDNVLLPRSFERFRPTAAERRAAAELLDRMEAPSGSRDVATLSRGEQQRVALARALLHRPPILIADEPTASLDAANGTRVIELLTGFARERGATLITVSHDPALLAAMDAVYVLAGARLELRAAS